MGSSPVWYAATGTEVQGDKLTAIVLNRTSLSTAELPFYPGMELDNVTLVVSDGQAEEALAALMATDVVGFDTESKPTFLKDEVTTCQ